MKSQIPFNSSNLMELSEKKNKPFYSNWSVCEAGNPAFWSCTRARQGDWPWGFCTNNGDKFATRGFLKSSKLERGGCWNAFAWWLWTCEYTHNFLFTWHKSDPLPQQVALREKYPCPCGKYLVPWTCPCFLYTWCLLKLERDDKEKSNAEA